MAGGLTTGCHPNLCSHSVSFIVNLLILHHARCTVYLHFRSNTFVPTSTHIPLKKSACTAFSFAAKSIKRFEGPPAWKRCKFNRLEKMKTTKPIFLIWYAESFIKLYFLIRGAIIYNNQWTFRLQFSKKLRRRWLELRPVLCVGFASRTVADIMGHMVFIAPQKMSACA